MVIVELVGGLGNQMFQYALARRVSAVQKQRLVINPLSLKNNAFTTIERHYELKVFENIKDVSSLVTNQELETYKRYQNSKSYKAYNRARKLMGLRPAFTYCTDNFSMVYQGMPATDGQMVYLTGLWQNERWFDAVASDLKLDFRFPAVVSEPNRSMITHIKAANAVSVHIRRGDYLNDPEASKYADVCPIEYYQRAIAYIGERVENPTFFVFSNDIDWARENMIFSYPLVFVDINSGEQSYEDMRLMSLCQHNIIANSTFSWWGAWLNDNPQKIIIAPSVWLPKLGVTAEHIVPNTWVKL